MNGDILAYQASPSIRFTSDAISEEVSPRMAELFLGWKTSDELVERFNFPRERVVILKSYSSDSEIESDNPTTIAKALASELGWAFAEINAFDLVDTDIIETTGNVKEILDTTLLEKEMGPVVIHFTQCRKFLTAQSQPLSETFDGLSLGDKPPGSELNDRKFIVVLSVTENDSWRYDCENKESFPIIDLSSIKLSSYFDLFE